jgi:[acyl-carrier-protein] S-malonyltransferase
MRNCAFIFPGQGSQQVGMGYDLVSQYPVAAAVFAEADQVLGFALSKLCFGGPAEILTDTLNAQPAILTASIALLRVWQSQGQSASPQFVAGHSMGEYSALVAAGVFSFADGLRLVRERGRLMKRAGEVSPGSMAAVLGLDRESLAQVCQQASTETSAIVQIANDNAPGQVVVSGDRVAVQRAGDLAKTAGAKRVVPLAVSIAAHSPLMNTITDDFRQAVAQYPMNPPEIPVISNILARPLVDVESIRHELVEQLVSPVRWVESISWMTQQGAGCYIEFGPGAVLTGLVKRIVPDARFFNVKDAATATASVDAVEG